MRVTGRDFICTGQSTGTAVLWQLVGGVPLTPAAFGSSVLTSYCSAYQKFKIVSATVSYVTSSPTTANGDVCMSYIEQHTDGCPNFGSNSFLNSALSDPNTMLGPQWENNTSDIGLRVHEFKDICFLPDGDINDNAVGEIQFFSKTSSTDSPGYFILDYVIEFYELGNNARMKLMPSPSQLVYQPFQMIVSGGSTTSAPISMLPGTTWIGRSAIAPTISVGTIYKCMFSVTEGMSAGWSVSAGTKPTLANVLGSYNTATTLGNPFTIYDGFTVYMRVDYTLSTLFLYSSYTAALTTTNPLSAGIAYTPDVYNDNGHNPSAGVWLYCMISAVGSAYVYQNQNNS